MQYVDPAFPRLGASHLVGALRVQHRAVGAQLPTVTAPTIDAPLNCHSLVGEPYNLIRAMLINIHVHRQTAHAFICALCVTVSTVEMLVKDHVPQDVILK